MHRAPRDRVRILLEQVFHPLVVEQPRTVDEVVQAAHRQRRLHGDGIILRLNRGSGIHDGGQYKRICQIRLPKASQFHYPNSLTHRNLIVGIRRRWRIVLPLCDSGIVDFLHT